MKDFFGSLFLCYADFMNNPELEDFYTSYVLPQFEVKLKDIKWEEEKRIHGDEFAFWFTENQKRYLLIWIDYQDSGLKAEDIKSLLDLDAGQYKFIEPNERKYSPSFRTPDWKYEEKFVGWFTLLELT